MKHDNIVAMFNFIGFNCFGVGVFIFFGWGGVMIYIGFVSFVLAVLVTASQRGKIDPIQRGIDKAREEMASKRQ